MSQQTTSIIETTSADVSATLRKSPAEKFTKLARRIASLVEKEQWQQGSLTVSPLEKDGKVEVCLRVVCQQADLGEDIDADISFAQGSLSR